MSRRSASPLMPRRLLAALLGAAVLLGPGRAAAQGVDVRAQVASEARVQAAFMLKFPGYVEWPGERQPAPASAAVIAVADADPIAEELRRIAARIAPQARPVVKTVRAGDSLAGVHMLYVGGGDWRRYQRWVQQAAEHATLLVSAHPGALEHGSVINFRLEGERVRFEVSMAAAEQANLRIGAALLQLAVAVQRGK